MSVGTLASVVGVLVVVEFTSGVLQGWYTPMLTDIARSLDIRDADVNWFEVRSCCSRPSSCRRSRGSATCSATSACCSGRPR
ncbi:hypothetical protein [Rathayibacter oskolensis]|uniref:hypothetical protein n=1 Tax=Rathayibacter oskolensis TaxID=1891671 RepID=UPI003465A739